MADQIIAPIALAIFIIFLGFLAVYIGELDLWIIVVGVSMLAVTDFVQELRNSGNSSAANKKGKNR